MGVRFFKPLFWNSGRNIKYQKIIRTSEYIASKRWGSYFSSHFFRILKETSKFSSESPDIQPRKDNRVPADHGKMTKINLIRNQGEFIQ